MYWFSMLKVPAASEFPLGPVQSQPQWLNTIKQGACQSCHALGTPGMRKVPELFMKMGNGSSHEAWRHRLRSGSAQNLMARDISRLDGERAIANFADWTNRIEKGELPFDRPRRPEGLERNLVITMWDYLRPEFYLHDVVSTDRRNPRVNPNGAVYGSPEDSTDIVPVVDPRTHRAIELPHPVRDPATPSVRGNPYGVSAYFGDKPYWEGRTLNHNPMMDERGRTWFTSRISPDPNPDWCKAGSDHPSAKAFPLNGGANRHLSYFDPFTNSWTLIRTCFPTHHLNFTQDNVLWTSPGVVGPGVIGWFDAKVFEATKDERRSQGWTPFILDTNGDGKRGEYVAHDQPLDPKKDKQVMVNHYSVAVTPSDGSIWATVLGYPGAVIRVVPGADPTNTALTELYEPPLPGYGPRGARRRFERRVLGVALERAPGRVRPPEVPRDQRPDRHRQALPRGLDPAPISRAAAPRREGSRQRRDELLRVGRPLRNSRTRKGRSDRHGQRLGLGHAVRRRQIHRAAPALSLGTLPEECRRAHRRRGGGLEGPRHLDHLRLAHQFPSRRREREPA